MPVTRAMFVWLDALWARFKSLRLRTTFKRQVVPKVVLDRTSDCDAHATCRRIDLGHANERGEMTVLAGKLHEFDAPLTILQHVAEPTGLRLPDSGIAALLPHAE